MPQNAVYKYFYKHVQKAMPFQALALWPNFFMNFETENSPCLKLHLKKCSAESNLLKFYWCLCFKLIVLHVPRQFHKGHFRKANSADG